MRLNEYSSSILGFVAGGVAVGLVTFFVVPSREEIGECEERLPGDTAFQGEDSPQVHAGRERGVVSDSVPTPVPIVLGRCDCDDEGVGRAGWPEEYDSFGESSVREVVARKANEIVEGSGIEDADCSSFPCVFMLSDDSDEKAVGEAVAEELGEDADFDTSRMSSGGLKTFRFVSVFPKGSLTTEQEIDLKLRSQRFIERARIEFREAGAFDIKQRPVGSGD